MDPLVAKFTNKPTRSKKSSKTTSKKTSTADEQFMLQAKSPFNTTFKNRYSQRVAVLKKEPRELYGQEKSEVFVKCNRSNSQYDRRLIIKHAHGEPYDPDVLADPEERKKIYQCHLYLAKLQQSPSLCRPERHYVKNVAKAERATLAYPMKPDV